MRQLQRVMHCLPVLIISVCLYISTPVMAEESSGILSQAEQALENHDAVQANKLLAPLLAAHSGKANLLLAKQAVTDKKGQAAITYALQAAQYGYPERAYTLMAKLYQTGLGEVKQNDLLTACYFNLARAYPNEAFINKCLLEASGSFKVMHHLGMQNTAEAQERAREINKAFCSGRSQGLFNPRLDKRTLQALEQKWCQAEDLADTSTLKPGELVMQDEILYQVDDQHQLSSYQSPLDVGDLVNVKQPEYQTYLFDGKQLILAKTNATVIKNNQLYYFVDGKLSLKKSTNLTKGETSDE